jgi:hypothetical protein
VEKKFKKLFKKKYAKSDKTQPDPDGVSLSARRAFTARSAFTFTFTFTVYRLYKLGTS